MIHKSLHRKQMTKQHKSHWNHGLKTTSRSPLCFKEPEDTKHFLLKCIILNSTRSKFIKKLKDLLELKLVKPLVFELFECDNNLLQLIVDCTKFHFLNELHVYTDIERLTSSMCFALHLKRSNLIFKWSHGFYVSYRGTLLCWTLVTWEWWRCMVYNLYIWMIFYILPQLWTSMDMS